MNRMSERIVRIEGAFAPKNRVLAIKCIQVCRTCHSVNVRSSVIAYRNYCCARNMINYK